MPLQKDTVWHQQLLKHQMWEPLQWLLKSCPLFFCVRRWFITEVSSILPSSGYIKDKQSWPHYLLVLAFFFFQLSFLSFLHLSQDYIIYCSHLSRAHSPKPQLRVCSMCPLNPTYWNTSCYSVFFINLQSAGIMSLTLYLLKSESIWNFVKYSS